MRSRSLTVTLAAVVVAVAASAMSCGDNRKPPGAPGPGPGPGQGEPPAAPGVAPMEVTCRTIPASTNTCDVTAGSSAMLLEGTVLTPTKVYKGGQVGVDDTGRITCVGCDCAKGGETKISCSDAAISPGLINTHDHITYTHNDPYSDTGVRYEDRQQWRIGLDQRAKLNYDSGASGDQVSWGELRFLMGGATSIVGSGGARGFLRNLDQSAANQEGLGKRPVDFNTFPLDDANGTRRDSDCNYGGNADTQAKLDATDAYEPHTSEGIDATAHNEFLCESSATYDTASPGVSSNLVVDKTAMIHAIGLTAADYGAMATAGTGLIWSPRSNLTLYGETARVTVATQLGVEIALGTDWMPTGSMSLLRELTCADSFNAKYLHHFFRDDQLWAMVTVNAASVTATSDLIGVLAPGMIADISIFASHGRAPFRSVIEAEPKDVALVMRGGKVLYGDDAVVNAFNQGCDTVDVCGSGKRVCAKDEVNKSYGELQTAANPAGRTIYPAFTCGAPMNEPSCIPERSESVDGSTIYSGMISALDSDGDGIADADDNCPFTFNPVRPLDGGVQGDDDGDGIGDACDACPLDANSTDCKPVDYTDSDHDGVPNLADNCPSIANMDQADDDHDGKGNACDACPAEANPGVANCVKTIYQIKSGAVAVDTPVRIVNAIVTGRGSNGFFVQIKETDAGYTAPENSGIFVFTSTAPAASVVAGARVTVDGSIANFHDQIELDTVSNVEVTAPTDELPPAPIHATSYAEVKSGARAAALEGTIVQVGTAVVTSIAASGEITVTDSDGTAMIVDRFVFALPAPPIVGQELSGIIGILALRQPVPVPSGGAPSVFKLEPRGAADFLLGAPAMLSFGPALSFARVGATTGGATFPLPLTVVLTNTALGDTRITFTVSPADALTITNLVIPGGVTTGAVLVTANQPAADVKVTAKLGAQTLEAHVRVLGADEVPTSVTLSPARSGIAANGSTQLTATLDLPALVPTTIALSVAPVAAGTLPAEVTVPVGETSATFTYADTTSAPSATITATFLASTSSARVLITAPPTVLKISQVYGGGGNAGAPLTNDFIEIHNPSAFPVLLAGLSVQYAAAAAANWNNVTALPDVVLDPGHYLLVQEGGGATGNPLPTPEMMGMIAMSATNGNVALVSGIAPLPASCPAGNASVIDLVAYGSGACAEGGHAAPVLSNMTAAARKQNTCSDTNDNLADFATGAPAPRNTQSTAVICP